MNVTDTPVADAVRGHWADRFIPVGWRPYARMARLERPIGWWLLLWPCWWSSALATDVAGQWPNVWHLILFLVGAVAMRGAGCTYNDIVDRDLDAQVARTRSRPIPSGNVSVRNARLFLGAQALLGLLVLLQFNRFAVALGVLSLAAWNAVGGWILVLLGVTYLLALLGRYRTWRAHRSQAGLDG
jgi:4-hydroxybenzoate polyprenyltransferase